MERTRLLHTARHHVRFVPAKGDGADDLESRAQKRSRTDVDSAQIYQEVLSKPAQAQPSSVTEAVAPKTAAKAPPVSKRPQTPPPKRKLTVAERQKAKLSLFKAAQDGDVDTLTSLLREGVAEVDSKDEFGWTPLMSAAAAGHLAVVECLLEQGADPVACDAKSRRASTLADVQGHPRVAAVLLRAEKEKEKQRSSAGGGLPNGERSETKKRKGSPRRIVCDLCNVEMDEAEWGAHKTGTLHIFNEQHAPHNMINSSLLGGKGYRIMLKSGWEEGLGLGVDNRGVQNPVKTVLKRDRHGIGVKSQASQARVTHFQPFDEGAIETVAPKEVKPRLSKREQTRQRRREAAFERDLRRYMNT